MIAEGIQKLEELIRKNTGKFEDKDGKEYTLEEAYRLYDDPRPAELKVWTLASIKDYLKTNIDSLSKSELLLHVVDYNRVDLVTNVHGEKNERHTVLTAQLDGEEFPFGRYLDQEDFIIKVRSMFKPTEDREFILVHTAKVDMEKNIGIMDDGVTQQVEIKQGVRGQMTESELLKPIVSLKPFRTFLEVEQPKSEFLFRMRHGRNGGAEAALFEADGGAWKNEARSLIAEYLKDTEIAILS